MAPSPKTEKYAYTHILALKNMRVNIFSWISILSVALKKSRKTNSFRKASEKCRIDFLQTLHSTPCGVTSLTTAMTYLIVPHQTN